MQQMMGGSMGGGMPDMAQMMAAMGVSLSRYFVYYVLIYCGFN